MNFDLPYAAARSPVCAANVVASSQPLATQAGLQALRQGGNAVDAAIATAITLTVVEPCMNGIGSDAFAILWDGNKLRGLNASGRSPQAWQRKRFDRYKSMPMTGWDSITVPGAVSAWVKLSNQYGQLPFEDLFAAGIHYAEQGFQVGPVSANVWRAVAPGYKAYPDFAEHFLPAPLPGQKFYRPDLIGTLKDIAQSQGASFYHGELAQKMVAASEAAGGVLSHHDLAQHEADWVEPIQQGYGDIHLHEIPPSGQGLAAQIALALLQHHETPQLDSADAIHLQVEAMKIAIRAAFDHFSDPRTMRVTPEELLASESIKMAAATITTKATRLPPVELPVSRDTVYLCAADQNGMMVSFIQSNYMSFGSGIVIPKTGIALQNRGSGFSLQPGHPNEVGPNKRPFHTIIPGFVTQQGAPQMAFGVMGGHMQAQGHIQMVSRVFDHEQNPQAASDAPRWIVNPDFSVGLESTMPQSILEDLAGRGHQVAYDRNTNTFGGAQLILRTQDGYVAGSDHRKEGCAAGY